MTASPSSKNYFCIRTFRFQIVRCQFHIFKCPNSDKTGCTISCLFKITLSGVICFSKRSILQRIQDERTGAGYRIRICARNRRRLEYQRPESDLQGRTQNYRFLYHSGRPEGTDKCLQCRIPDGSYPGRIYGK